MAICKSCGVEQAGFMSDLCGKCLGTQSSAAPASNAAQAAAVVENPLSEGDYTSMIGQALIWLSLASAVICVFAFGRVEIPSVSEYSSPEKVWNASTVIACITVGLNGAFFGFLLSKVGSVLKHLEKLRSSN